MEEYSRLYKIIVVGDTGTGKSQIVSRFIQGTFSEEIKPTIVMEHSRKVMKEKQICAQVWDMSGKEIFKTTACCYYKYSLGAMIVYDITKVRSFENASDWLKHLQKVVEPDCPVTMLIGNKLDLKAKRSISTKEGRALAKENNALFLETSALDATNIAKAFNVLVGSISAKFDETQRVKAGDETRSSPAKIQTGETVVQQQPISKTPKGPMTKKCVEGTKYCCSKVPFCFA